MRRCGAGVIPGVRMPNERLAVVLVSGLEGGELRASIGVDLSTVGPTPGHELVHAQINPDGGNALPIEFRLFLLHLCRELGIGRVECAAVDHDGLGLVPLGL